MNISKKLNENDVEEIVSNIFGVTIKQIHSKSREKRTVAARYFCMGLIDFYLNLSVNEIAERYKVTKRMPRYAIEFIDSLENKVDNKSKFLIDLLSACVKRILVRNKGYLDVDEIILKDKERMKNHYMKTKTNNDIVVIIKSNNAVAIPYNSLSDKFKKSIDSIEKSLNKDKVVKNHK
jgi:hypothetical protein